MEGNEIYEQKNKEDYPIEVEERVNKFVDFAHLYRTGGNLAELGCGNGYFARQLQYRFNPWDSRKIIQFDLYDYYPAKKDINFCDLTLQDDTRYLNRTIHAKRKYDTVFCSHVLEHVNAGTALKIIRDDFVVEDGLLIFSVPLGEYDNKHRPFDRDIGHVTVWTRYNVTSRLYNNGWRPLVESIVQFDFCYPELWVVAKRN